MQLRDLRFDRLQAAGMMLSTASQNQKIPMKELAAEVDTLGGVLLTNGLVHAMMLQRTAPSSREAALPVGAVLACWLEKRFRNQGAGDAALGKQAKSRDYLDEWIAYFLRLEKAEQRRYLAMQEEAVAFVSQMKLVAKALDKGDGKEGRSKKTSRGQESGRSEGPASKQEAGSDGAE